MNKKINKIPNPLMTTPPKMSLLSSMKEKESNFWVVFVLIEISAKKWPLSVWSLTFLRLDSISLDPVVHFGGLGWKYQPPFLQRQLLLDQLLLLGSSCNLDSLKEKWQTKLYWYFQVVMILTVNFYCVHWSTIWKDLNMIISYLQDIWFLSLPHVPDKPPSVIDF